MDRGGYPPGEAPPWPPGWQPLWPGWPNDPDAAQPPVGYPSFQPGYPGHPGDPAPPGFQAYPVNPGPSGWTSVAPPPDPAIPYLASTGDRIGAFLIDALILLLPTIPVYALIFVTFFAFVVPEAPFVAAPFVMFPLMLLPIFTQMAYVALTEGRGGQSLGKRTVGNRVVKLDGRPIAWHDTPIRWICQVVDQQPTLGILGPILVATRPLKQRVGDLAAGTVVVRARRCGSGDKGQRGEGAKR